MSADDLLWFGTHQRPFEDSLIYLARYAGETWATNRAHSVHAVGMDGEAPRNHTQITTICAGKLVLQVVTFTGPRRDIAARRIERDGDAFSVTVHPSDGEPKEWPPRIWLDDNGFYELGNIGDAGVPAAAIAVLTQPPAKPSSDRA